MTNTLWLAPSTEGGPLALIEDEQGRLVLCAECPCQEDEDCEQSVDAKVAELLSEVVPGTQQALWTLQGTHTSDYVCAVWTKDETTQTWSLSSRASGHLLVALAVGATVGDTAEGGASLLTYAKTLVNTQTHQKRTVGCQCRVYQHECRHRMVTLDDMDIAGSLPVWEPAAGEEYEPADGCRVDSCELLKLKMTTAQLWHGGTAMGEGYYDWLLNPQQWEPANYRYQPFLQAIRWTDSTLGDMLTYLDCDCDGIYTHNLATGETCLEYAGICTLEDPCIQLMLLHNKAEANGWTWHDEGVLVHLAKCTVDGNVLAYGDWYAIRDQQWTTYNGTDYAEYPYYSRYMCAADTGDGYWVLGCACASLTFYSKNSPVQNYWTYLDMPGICACSFTDGNYPDRELLLAYPEVFGVDDIVWGNDNKFSYDYTTSYTDLLTGTVHTTTHDGCLPCGIVYEPVGGHGGRTMYIDYRAMCFTGKAFDKQGNEKTWVRVIYPNGSPGAQSHSGGSTRYFARPSSYPGSESYDEPYAIYDTVSFTGTQFTPFTHDSGIYTAVNGSRGLDGLTFTGWNYAWYAAFSMPGAVPKINGCQPEEEYAGDEYSSASDEARVRALAGCNSSASICLQTETTSSSYWACAAVLTPDFTTTEHQCSVRYEIESGPGGGTYKWYYVPKWVTIGAACSSSPDNCGWMILNVCYVETNKGFVIKGLATPQESYVLIGAGNYPEYTNCWPWTGDCQPQPDPWDGGYYDPCHYYDATITCPADEDMHFCLEGFDSYVAA